MKLLRNSLLSLSLLTFAATAYAGPAPKGPAVIQPAPEPVGGPYVTIAGGALWLHDADVNGADIEFDTGFSVLAAVGYAFGNGLAVEVESGYMEADFQGHADYLGQHVDFDGEFRQVPIMANVLYHMDITDKLGFYIGGGAGIVWSETEVESVQGLPFSASYDDWEFALQAKAGLCFHINEAASVNIGYRFIHVNDAIGGSDDSKGHVLEGGFTYRF